MDFDNFTQVVILGNAKYTPFMQLNKGDRREFIEWILDIGVFSTMNEVLKNRQKILATKLETLGRDIETKQEKIKLIDGFITKLESEQKKATQATQSQIDDQNVIIDALEPEIDALQVQVNAANDKIVSETERINEESQGRIDEIQSIHDAHIEELDAKVQDFTELNDKLVKWCSYRSTFENNIKGATATLSFYTKNDSCNTCKQSIHQDFKDKIVAEKQAIIDENQLGLTKLEAKISKQQQDINSIKKLNAEIQAQVSKAMTSHQVAVQKIMMDSRTEVKTLTASLHTYLRELQEKLQVKQSAMSAARQFIKKMQADMKTTAASTNIEEQRKKKSGFEAGAETLEAEKTEAIETRHYYEMAALLLRDDGIKAAIIKQYLNTINKLVNKYLSDMDFFVSFHLDENFKEEFKSRHRDSLSYENFSEGEKMRIDLALLFSWREIARMKNSCATNLLILDEVIDSSLDHNGTDFFIRMLNDLGNSNHTSNVFVISHKNDAALDKFKDVLHFTKEKNFSRLDDGGMPQHSPAG